MINIAAKFIAYHLSAEKKCIMEMILKCYPSYKQIC